MTVETDILVAGAGPAGRTLALQASMLGARVRVVERRTRVSRPSRALIVHPRTLEVLRPLGVADALLAHAENAARVCLHSAGTVVHASLDDLTLPSTPYPHLTFARQADVEAALGAALADRDVTVDRGTELIGCRTGRYGTEAVLRSAGRITTAGCRWIAGCDGAGSAVRDQAGLARRETAYRQEILLADVRITSRLPLDAIHVHAGRRGLCFLFPLGEQAPWRLLVTRPATGASGGSGRPGPAPEAAELQRLLDLSGVPVRLTAVAWSTRLRLRYGVAAVHGRAAPSRGAVAGRPAARPAGHGRSRHGGTA